MNAKPNTIGVYCASSVQIDSVYTVAASRLGKILATEHIACYNGGGATGLMGALTDSMLQCGGSVTGIIPQFMVDNGWHHPRLSHIEIVGSMHERKARIAGMSDAVVALPGGIGTLEELLEILTWKQLGLFAKPIVILNVANYYAPLLDMLKQAITQHFMRPQHAELWKTVVQPEDVLPAIASMPLWNKSLSKI